MQLIVARFECLILKNTQRKQNLDEHVKISPHTKKIQILYLGTHSERAKRQYR